MYIPTSASAQLKISLSSLVAVAKVHGKLHGPFPPTSYATTRDAPPSLLCSSCTLRAAEGRQTTSTSGPTSLSSFVIETTVDIDRAPPRVIASQLPPSLPGIPQWARWADGDRIVLFVPRTGSSSLASQGPPPFVPASRNRFGRPNLDVLRTTTKLESRESRDRARTIIVHPFAFVPRAQCSLSSLTG
ncbi:hypothetical protein LY78DRAFT_128121 [Colletotrichum sublineola]|nr:hypothetical protein LY78DRAFT_128121 [Colletotrichum sublineola]